MSVASSRSAEESIRAPTHNLWKSQRYILQNLCPQCCPYFHRGKQYVCRSSHLCTRSHLLQTCQTIRALADRPYIAWIDWLFTARAMSPESSVGTVAICQESRQIAAIGEQRITTKSSSLLFKAVTLAEVFAYCCSQVSERKWNENPHFSDFLSVPFTFLRTPKIKGKCFVCYQRNLKYGCRN